MTLFKGQDILLSAELAHGWAQKASHLYGIDAHRMVDLWIAAYGLELIYSHEESEHILVATSIKTNSNVRFNKDFVEACLYPPLPKKNIDRS